MSAEGIRVGVGTRVLHDGQLWEVTELHPGPAGTEVVLGAYGRHSEVVRISLRELLDGLRARVYGEGSGPNSDDPLDPADVVLSALSASEREAVRRRACDIREVLTGYRCGAAELAQPGEPRTGYDPALPLTARYAAKAAELGVSMRTVQSWAADYLAYGEAGLARGTVSRQNPTGRVDERWVQTAVEVMVEHTDQSRPSQAMVIKRTNARVAARFGPDVVALPSRTAAYRILTQLENRYPLFRLSTKRNRDIAARPGGAYPAQPRRPQPHRRPASRQGSRSRASATTSGPGRNRRNRTPHPLRRSQPIPQHHRGRRSPGNPPRSPPTSNQLPRNRSRRSSPHPSPT